jgi:hypothetical protein
MAALSGQALATDVVRNDALEGQTSTRSPRVNRLLIYFQNSSGLHNRRFLLALGEAFRPFAVDVHAGKLLAVVIIDRHLPMLVFAPAVPVESGCLARFASLLRLASLAFFHCEGPSKSKKTMSISGAAHK